MKKRNIMSIEIIAALLTALAVLTSSCAIGGIGNETNDEDDIEMEETHTTEDNDIETEVPDISVDDGGEEDTSQTWTTIKEMQEMQVHMIRLLNDNYDVFNRIVAYFEEEPEIIAFWEEEGEIVGRYEKTSGLIQSIDLDEVEVGEDIAYVIYELGFVGILDGSITVDFYMVSKGIKPGGSTYDQKLVYIKSTAGEYGILKDVEERNNPLGVMHIRDEWYYEGFDHSRYNF